MKFEYNGNKYEYIPFNELTTADLPKKKDFKRSAFLDMGCGFDIETTKIPDENLSFMYVWQFAINNLTVIGRNWDEFREFLDMISDFYELRKKPLLVWVHNLSFEFQFIKNQLTWKQDKKGRFHIFAMDNRKIVKATTENGIEFRDSLILTQMSLSQVAKSYELDIKKLDEDGFDYDKLRFADTVLSDMELAYCINDVQILQKFYHKYIKKEFIQKHLPVSLTSTGIVRDELNRNFKKWNKKEKNKYLRLLRRAFPEEDTYKAIIRWLYRGGMVHSNSFLTGNTWINIGLAGADIKSSYPSSICHELYPDEFIERTPEWWYQNGHNKAITKKIAYYGTFVFTNIQAIHGFSLESKNKCIYVSDDAIWDNGRLVKASKLTVMLTEVDFEMYEMLYKWDEVECLSCFISQKRPLPTFVLDLVLKYYFLKESLPSGYERNCVKRKLNAIYGMMVTGLFHTTLNFNDDTGMFEEAGIEKSYAKIIENEILLPQYGIWVTAYSRYRLVKAMVQCGDDHNIYNDTDSCKIMNYDGCKHVFDAHNDLMHRLNKKMYIGKYDRKYFMNMGIFDIEYDKMWKFKTLGSKRYCYTVAEKDKDGMVRLHDQTVIAGMKKGSLQKYCKKNDIDIYEAFRNDLQLSAEESDKLTTSYEDVEWIRIVAGHEVSEKSCVTLIKIPFSMTMAVDYLMLLEEVSRMNSRKIGREKVI